MQREKVRPDEDEDALQCPRDDMLAESENVNESPSHFLTILPGGFTEHLLNQVGKDGSGRLHNLGPVDPIALIVPFHHDGTGETLDSLFE